MIGFKYRWQKIYLSVLVIVSTIGGIAYWYGSNAMTNQIVVEQKKDSVILHNLPKPTFLFGLLANNLVVSESQVKRNQRFTDLLQGYHLKANIQRQISLVPRNVFDFKKITSSKKYTILSYPDSIKSLRALVYEASPIDYVIFHLDDTLLIEVCQRPVEIIEKIISAEIDFSLAQTIEQLGISNELTNRFVDVFAWQVDFHRLQKGDRFKAIYNELQVGGVAIGVEQILGAYFEHADQGYSAFPFDQGDGVDYFDHDGKSLRKALLKFPIEYTRISSRYSLNRFHPIAKVVRPHRGTDFAAPSGTPIRTVGDGVITEAQYKTNNGNYVKVKHNGTYSTQYLHMSKIARGIRSGVAVTQGQIIGYVGSTGLSTGPHLCYRFWKNGVQVDALKIDLPPSQPIRPEMLQQFQTSKVEILKKLDLILLPAKTEDPLVAVN